MLAFGYVYFAIIVMSLVSGLIYVKIGNHTRLLTCCAEFCAIYYFALCFFRTIVSNGAQYLGTAMADKSVRAYLIAGTIGIVVFGAIQVFRKIAKEKGQTYITLVVGIFVTGSLLFTVLIDMPRMQETVIIGIVSMFFGAILLFVPKKDIWTLMPDESEHKKQYFEIGVPVFLFCSLFLLTGPLEIFAYNTKDFVFNMSHFLPYMLIYSVGLLTVTILVVGTCVPQWLFNFTKVCIFLYCICSYIQQMFLNGNMSRLEGNEQRWSAGTNMVNLIIWFILIALILFVLKKSQKGNRIITYVSAFVAGVQLITFVIVLLTSGMSSIGNRQLIQDDKYALAKNENLVIFILDAFDVQMMDKVLEDDPQYLEPLHDFTYYKNMVSRYTATDGSLPYLLTGRIPEEETVYEDIYSKSTFLKDIKGYGYDINLLTTQFYVEPFEDGLVSNITDDFYCTLDFEKTVSQMSECVRYRSAPFILKPLYYYENYNLTNIIHDTNIYLVGEDAAFYSDLMESGVCVETDRKPMMYMYHLYGAHSPYYLTENAELDFNSNPIAQWKGCLKIVYDYLEQLRKNGLYDTTSVIIMADHGLNRTQREAMDEWNIQVTDKTNPIFFVKGRNQKQKQLVIDNAAVSHDNFFATVMKLIDEENENYGKAVWEQ